MKVRPAAVIISLSIALATSGALLTHFFGGQGISTLPTQYFQATHTQTADVPTLNHVVIIVEENKPRSSIVGSPNAPYSNSLMREFATASHYYAVTHPSLPNYIALTSGTTAGIQNDCNPPSTACQADVPNITDTLEQAHQTWKAYQEDMPAPCTTVNSGTYAVRHDPFLYYPQVRTDAKRCSAHVVPFNHLASDLQNLPNYAFITPNLCHDMHDCSVRTGDDWLASHVPAILSSPAFTTQRSLLVIVWDEGDEDSNEIPIIFAGPAAKQGYTSNQYYSHYSLLRTIEVAKHLPPLTSNDRDAPLMTDMLLPTN